MLKQHYGNLFWRRKTICSSAGSQPIYKSIFSINFSSENTSKNHHFCYPYNTIPEGCQTSKQSFKTQTKTISKVIFIDSKKSVLMATLAVLIFDLKNLI